MSPIRRAPAAGFPIAVFGAAFALAGCSGPLSALDPAGPAAAEIAVLWWVMFWGSVVLFALVIGLLLLTILRPGFGSSLSPRTWIISGGLAMPIVVLALLVIYAFLQGERLLFGAPEGAPLRVEAHGRQWAWSFSYPDFPAAPPTEGVLRIPAGRVVEVVALSSDVIHSFWVPRLGGKIDAVPGHRNAIRLLADRPGTYGGVCAEFCGTGHTMMRFTVEALPPEDYEAALLASEGADE